jgi:hypothetical protein
MVRTGDPISDVVVRLDRTTQYSREAGVLDSPPEPVIGLAEGETGGGE